MAPAEKPLELFNRGLTAIGMPPDGMNDELQTPAFDYRRMGARMVKPKPPLAIAAIPHVREKSGKVAVEPACEQVGVSKQPICRTMEGYDTHLPVQAVFQKVAFQGDGGLHFRHVTRRHRRWVEMQSNAMAEPQDFPQGMLARVRVDIVHLRIEKDEIAGVYSDLGLQRRHG